MNVFLKELKTQYKGLIGWSIGLMLVIVSGFSKYAMYQTSGQSLSELFSQFPKALLAFFGMAGIDLSSIGGFYSVIFLYIALMAAIHAVMLGVSLIAGEEMDKTAEFLFPKPVSRKSVVSAKMLAGLVNIVVINLVSVASSLLCVTYYNKGAAVTGDILLLTVAMFLIQALFFVIGTSLAALFKNLKLAGPVATSILLGGYLLSILIGMESRLNALRFLTPFRYFEASRVFETHQLEPIYLGIPAVFIILLTVSTYILFGKRDLEV